ncbi:MAG: ribosomal protein S18-alanine N-acetyltransferase [Candidatus Heimdallarchaeota archaeon]|nr:ribosomal protein S18-alanine N-acetyltransferase [Candidatus Heimdallarchaeota archaeon]MCK5303740.1 ribosomal protein S18-alanine N-acetyltransferase [Candidatus Heimdallarchaeota archaeon]
MNNIRQMTKDDIPHVYEIERKSFPYPFGEVLIGSLYFGAPELCYVLEQNGKIIGFLLGGYTPTPRQAHILSFAILESFRGEGLGKELFIHLLNQLENLEFDSVKLEVNVDNQRAIELYESLQFKIESRIRKYYQDNSDAFTMIRSVD